MFPKYALHEIRIESLDNINLIQQEQNVTVQMREFVQLVYAREVFDKEQWSYRLYRDTKYITTLDRFIDTCQSVRDRGYLVRRINVPDSYWNSDSARIGRPSDALLYPLVSIEDPGPDGGILIRGGNHRAACLYVSGVRYTPVIRNTHVVTHDRIEKKAADIAYMEQYNQAIAEFLTTEAWLDYKSTNCYNRSFGRVKHAET